GHARRQEIPDRWKPGAPEQTRGWIEKDSGATRSQELDFVRRDVRAGNSLHIRAEAADLIKQFNLPNAAAEMASDHLVELGRLGHVHVERKAVIARDPARFTEPVLVYDPGQQRPDGQTKASTFGFVPASGEACDPPRLLFRGLAEPRIE